ncbi:MAG: thiamine phosphate synthase [Dehalococcoidia bacterium]|nr:thiamine phosphate synthase [Dehalococcoidia bacterium]
MNAAQIRGLYVIVDPEQTRGRDAVEVARQALEGGARVIQWRDKTREKGVQLPEVRAVRSLCEEHGALLIVNDHFDLALAASAHGVHLGQKDLPAAEVKGMAPKDFLIGVSTNNVEEARRAQKDGAGYVAVGSVFPTATKGVTRPASLERLAEVKAAVRVPVVAIGGINEGNIARVAEAGADAAAVISAVCEAEDVKAAAQWLKVLFEAAAGKGVRESGRG